MSPLRPDVRPLKELRTLVSSDRIPALNAFEFDVGSEFADVSADFRVELSLPNALLTAEEICLPLPTSGVPAPCTLDAAASALVASEERKSWNAFLPWTGVENEAGLSELIFCWTSVLKEPTAVQMDLT